jgi:hypothetical protein
MKPQLKLIALLLVLLSLPALTRAQGTAFSYQGHLVGNGAAANGGYDFIFALFGSAAGVDQVGATMQFNNVSVANGQFNVTLDFGAAAFMGAPRWLEISVRPTGVGQFTKMNARVSLLGTPYAIFATTAGSVANGGVTANQLNTGGQGPAPGQFLAYNGGSLVWSDPGVAVGDVWSRNGLDAYYNSGNVGIGGLAGTSKLQISGADALTLSAPGPYLTWHDTTSGRNAAISSAGGTLYYRVPDALGNVLTAGYVDSNGMVTRGRLSVEGSADIAPGGSGGAIHFGTPSTETGMTIIGANRADVRFDGTTLKLLAGTGITPPGRGIFIDTQGNVGPLNFASGLDQKLSLWSDPAFTRYFTIGIQDSTLYNRCGGGGADGFAWYKGGIHDIHYHNAGGGQSLMTLDSNGLFVTGPASVCTLTIRGGCDLAEPFAMKEPQIEKGSVVVIDEEHPGQLKLSTRAYDTRVAGIVSGANGVNTGLALLQEGTLEAGQNVALTGRVYVQADTGGGAIKPGDLLTTSNEPGHAMKVSDPAKAQGAILGKAMSGLSEGRGMVLVLVTLQ